MSHPEQPADPQPHTPQYPAAPAAPSPYGQQYAAQPYQGQPYPGQFGAPYPYAYAPEPGTNVLAIISLISAFFVSIAAIITGHIALAQIKRTGEKGRGLALAGLIIGYVSVALGALLVIAWLVLFFSIMGNSMSTSGISS